MARTVVCKHCKKRIPRNEALIITKLNEKTLNMYNHFYCDETCHENYENTISKKESDKNNKEKCYNVFHDILDYDVRCNVYFNKLFKEMMSNFKLEHIYTVINEIKFEVKDVLSSKYFSNGNAEIKYMMAILQSKVSAYAKEVEEIGQNNKDNDIIFNLEDLDLDIPITTPKPKKSKKRRSLDEIFENL